MGQALGCCGADPLPSPLLPPPPPGIYRVVQEVAVSPCPQLGGECLHTVPCDALVRVRGFACVGDRWRGSLDGSGWISVRSTSGHMVWAVLEPTSALRESRKPSVSGLCWCPPRCGDRLLLVSGIGVDERTGQFLAQGEPCSVSAVRGFADMELSTGRRIQPRGFRQTDAARGEVDPRVMQLQQEVDRLSHNLRVYESEFTQSSAELGSALVKNQELQREIRGLRKKLGVPSAAPSCPTSPLSVSKEHAQAAVKALVGEGGVLSATDEAVAETLHVCGALSAADARFILCGAAADAEEARRSSRQLLLQLHPDKVPRCCAGMLRPRFDLVNRLKEKMEAEHK
eukprot:TRINITY_DN9066_c0_g2_i1.p1 TRINITY_DN9066_c0_g2~~TRINITY_DN9066_c0_g2_i1.p1  ORF type:complete len:360 (+),score=52.81 TRINITY_DN9066_c0_g2_i1:55-1080(+)